MKRAFKWVGMLLLAYIIFFGSYFYYSLYSGSARMAKLCGQIKPGMAWTDLPTIGGHANEHAVRINGGCFKFR